MEVQTKEEIHVLIYFDKFEDIYEVYKIVYENLPDIEKQTRDFRRSSDS